MNTETVQPSVIIKLIRNNCISTISRNPTKLSYMSNKFSATSVRAIINAAFRHLDTEENFIIRIYEFKKRKILRGKRNFQSASPSLPPSSPPHAFRRTHNVHYIPAENVDTNNIQQKLDMPPQKKENERKDTRYNETKRYHDWKSVASGGPPRD